MNKKIPQHSKDDLLKFLKLSPKKKLEFLARLNEFLNAAMPKKNKEIWEKLKNKGF